MTIKLALYSTSACHLCELAAELLDAVPATLASWHEIEISEDENLLARYATRIPVVRREDSNAELGWPFDETQLQAFLVEGRSEK